MDYTGVTEVLTAGGSNRISRPRNWCISETVQKIMKTKNLFCSEKLSDNYEYFYIFAIKLNFTLKKKLLLQLYNIQFYGSNPGRILESET